MPTLEIDDHHGHKVSLRYEVHGHGPHKIMLVMGLGTALEAVGIDDDDTRVCVLKCVFAFV